MQMLCSNIHVQLCLVFIVSLKNISIIWGRHHYRKGAANFDLHVCSAFKAIAQ